MLAISLALPLLTDKQLHNAEQSAWRQLEEKREECRKAEEHWATINQEQLDRLNRKQINLVTS